MTDLSGAAWAVLLPAWGWRWAFILGLGLLPWLATRLLKAARRPSPKHFAVFRQACAFAACCLSIWSFQLAADTYLVESRDFASMTTKACSAGSGEAGEVVCSDGTSYRGLQLGPVSPGTKGKLYLLPRSELPFYFES